MKRSLRSKAEKFLENDIIKFMQFDSEKKDEILSEIDFALLSLDKDSDDIKNLKEFMNYGKTLRHEAIARGLTSEIDSLYLSGALLESICFILIAGSNKQRLKATKIIKLLTPQIK